MKKNIMLIAIVLFLLLPGVFAIQGAVTSFSEGSNINLTYQQAQNISISLRLPLETEVSTFGINVLGLSDKEYLYQGIPDSFNATGFCANAANIVDGDWGTFGSTDAVLGHNCTMLFNYTKRNGALNDTVWGGLIGTAHMNSSFNLTFRPECWKAYPDRIFMRAVSSYQNGGLGVGYYSYFDCYNGSAWRTLQLGNKVQQIYHTAMYWYGWNASIFPSGLTIKNDERILYNNASELNFTNTPTYINLSYSIINDIIKDGCNCTQCTLRGGYCNISLLIESESRGIYNFNNLNVTYAYGIDNCTGITGPGSNATAIEFYIREENDNRPLSSDIVGTFTYNLPHIETPYNFTIDLKDRHNFTICIYPEYSNLELDAYLQYNASGAIRERYYIENLTIDNSTDTVIMYNFASSTGLSTLTAILYTYYYDEYPNIIAKLQRYFPATNEWRTVQIDKSDELGQALFYIYEDTTDYKLLFEQQGDLLDDTVPLKFICDTTACEQSFIVEDVTQDVDWSGMVGSLDYNNITGIITFVWSDTSNTVETVRFLVEQVGLNSVTEICDSSQTSTSGTMTCNVSAYTGVINVRAFRSASPEEPFMRETIEKLTQKLRDIIKSDYSDAGGFYTFMMVLVVAGLGGLSPIAVILAAVFSIIIMYFLGLSSIVNFMFVVGATILGLTVAFIIKD